MARRTLLYRLLLTFFGLTQQHRKLLFDQIHQIVFHGQGGYSFTEVYELPIHLRKYIYNTLLEHYDSKKEKQEDGNTLADQIKSGAINIPEHMKGNKLKYNGG
jgi:hypothetical protein